MSAWAERSWCSAASTSGRDSGTEDSRPAGTSASQGAGAAVAGDGQIYCYVPNKEAIVHAIVERIATPRAGHTEDRILLLLLLLAAARVEFLAVLFEGTAFRFGNVRSADPALLEALYAETIERLLPAPGARP